MKITNEAEMLKHLSAKDREQAKRHVYKYTDCGAWIEFEAEGVKVGSIVEGADFNTETYQLRYPFSEDDYNARIQAIETEADAIWKWANETDETGQTPAEQGADAPDVALDYRYLKEPRETDER